MPDKEKMPWWFLFISPWFVFPVAIASGVVYYMIRKGNA